MFPLQDTIPSRSFPLVNWLLIAINLLVFLHEVSLGPEGIEPFVRTWGLVPIEFSQADRPLAWWEYYPFFTNMFLHGGWGHFIGNMWTLYIFGDNVEDRMGKGGYLLFYLLCGVAASYTHYALNMDSTVPAIGASGAISGVMGAYMFMFPYSTIIFMVPLFFMPYFFEVSAFFYLAVWFLGQFFSGTVSLLMPHNGAGIAFWAHVGGFVAGVLLFRFFARPPSREERQYPAYYRYHNYHSW